MWSRNTDRLRPDKGRGTLLIHRYGRERMIRSNCNLIPVEQEVLPLENCFRQTDHERDLRVCHGEEHSLLHHLIRRHDVAVSDIAVRGNQHEMTTVQQATNTTRWSVIDAMIVGASVTRAVISHSATAHTSVGQELSCLKSRKTTETFNNGDSKSVD